MGRHGKTLKLIESQICPLISLCRLTGDVSGRDVAIAIAIAIAIALYNKISSSYKNLGFLLS